MILPVEHRKSKHEGHKFEPRMDHILCDIDPRRPLFQLKKFQRTGQYILWYTEARLG